MPVTVVAVSVAAVVVVFGAVRSGAEVLVVTVGIVAGALLSPIEGPVATATGMAPNSARAGVEAAFGVVSATA